MKRFWKRLRKRRELDRDLEDELKFHLAMSDDQRRFGNATAIKEECRDMWTFTSIESFWQDLRYALRTLWQSPGVTLAAVVVLALGIGVNTMVFTVISKALNIDLGVDQPERLVVINVRPAHSSDPHPLLADLKTLASQVKSLEAAAPYRLASMNVSDRDHPPERFFGAQMSAGGFAVLRRQPLLGRVYTSTDEQPGAVPVVVISHRMWQSRYGADPSVVGLTIRVDDRPRAVIGVMPPGLIAPEDVYLWAPIDAVHPPSAMFGLLAENVKVGAARSEIEAFARALTNQYPDRLPGLVTDVHPTLDDYGRYANRPMYYAQLTAVALVLLIACADVANLLLARAAKRGREISIRIAIGAGRTRILRQLLIESVTLSSLGGFFGWLVARGFLHWFDRLTLEMNRPAWIDFSMDARVFVYLAAVSVATGILFGIAPALRLSKIDVNNAVKDGGAAASGGTHGRRLANALVIFETVLCIVLLTGSGLLIRSWFKVYRSPVGVNTANVLTVHVNLPEAKYPLPDDQIAFHRILKTHLEALPGVETVAIASAVPTWGFGMSRFTPEIEGQADANATVSGLMIGSNYFRVMQAPPLRGRVFADSEKESVVVNNAFVQKFLSNGDAIGKRLRISGTWRTITGVVPDIQQSISLEKWPLIYLPYASNPQRVVFLAARTRVPPGTLAVPFRREVQKLDEDLPLYDVQTLESRVAQNRLNVGALSTVFTLFGSIAMALGWVGLYAVVAHGVSRRTREIGIRMAIGGSSRSIWRLVFAQGMWPLIVGIAIGLPAAFVVTRVLRSSLVGVAPSDPLTFLAVVALLIAAGALGCAIPAMRATRVDPVAALRSE